MPRAPQYFLGRIIRNACEIIVHPTEDGVSLAFGSATTNYQTEIGDVQGRSRARLYFTAVYMLAFDGPIIPPSLRGGQADLLAIPKADIIVITHTHKSHKRDGRSRRAQASTILVGPPAVHRSVPGHFFLLLLSGIPTPSATAKENVSGSRSRVARCNPDMGSGNRQSVFTIKASVTATS